MNLISDFIEDIVVVMRDGPVIHEFDSERKFFRAVKSLHETQLHSRITLFDMCSEVSSVNKVTGAIGRNPATFRRQQKSAISNHRLVSRETSLRAFPRVRNWFPPDQEIKDALN